MSVARKESSQHKKCLCSSLLNMYSNCRSGQAIHLKVANHFVLNADVCYGLKRKCVLVAGDSRR